MIALGKMVVRVLADLISKLFYLALNNISKKWTMPLRDWKEALNRFTIQFEDRMSMT